MGGGVSKRRVAYIRAQVHMEVKGVESTLEQSLSRWHEEDALFYRTEEAATTLATLVKTHFAMRELEWLKSERDRIAATKIQTAARRWASRSSYLRLRSAAISVQRRRRGCGSGAEVCLRLQTLWHQARIGHCPRLARRFYLQVRCSAVVINRLARGYFGRQVAWEAKRWCSARILQCVLRMTQEKVRAAFMRSVVRPQQKISEKATQLQRHYRRWMALRRLEMCRWLLPKTKAAIWIQAHTRAWLKRVALWTLASTQGKQMRKTLMKALPDEQAGTLWRRWGRAGLTFDGLLSLRPNQLGGRIVFDAAGRLITEETLTKFGGDKLKRASRVVLASQQSLGHDSKQLAQPTPVAERFRKVGSKLMITAIMAKVPVISREEDLSQQERDERRWQAEEEEDAVSRAALELELKERQSFITRMTEAGQTGAQFGLDELRREVLQLSADLKKLDRRAATRAADRAVAAQKAAEREEQRLLEEKAHQDAVEICESILCSVLGDVHEEVTRKAREAANRGRIKLRSALKRLHGADMLGLSLVRQRREISWGLDPADRWRLQKQLKIDGPKHRQRQRLKGRWAGALASQRSTEAAVQIQCITRGRQLRHALSKQAVEGGGWPQVKELLRNVGLSRLAPRLARYGVDYVRLLELKPANLGGPYEVLDVRWPTKLGGWKWIKMHLPRWGCQLDDIKRLRFRVKSVEAPRLARAKQLLDFRANVGRKKYAALAKEVKLVFEQLAISPAGTDEAPELDKASFRALMVKLGIGLNRSQLNETWRWMDKDGDGSVQLDEFIHWWQKNREGLAGQSTALTRMFKDMFAKGAAIHKKHELLPFGVDGVYQCIKCNLYGPSAPETGTGPTYCAICLRCFVCCGGLPGHGEGICPGPAEGSNPKRARKPASISIRHGDAVHLSHQAYTEYLGASGKAHNAGVDGVPGGDTRMRHDGSLAAHSVSMTEYLGGGWSIAAQGSEAMKEAARAVREQWGVGDKARIELAAYGYVVGAGKVGPEPPVPPFERWWATPGTPAAAVSSDKITDGSVKKRWMGAMKVMRTAAERLLKDAQLAQDLQARTGTGAGAEVHATMLACARLILQQCEDVAVVFGRPSDAAQIIASQAEALQHLGNPTAAAGITRRGGGLQSPRSMFGDDTASERSSLSLETLPADGDGELPAIADRFRQDAADSEPKGMQFLEGNNQVVSTVTMDRSSAFVPRWPGDKGFDGPRCVACNREPARFGLHDGIRRWCVGCATSHPNSFDLGLEKDMEGVAALPLVETLTGQVYLHGKPISEHFGELLLHSGPKLRRQQTLENKVPVPAYLAAAPGFTELPTVATATAGGVTRR